MLLHWYSWYGRLFPGAIEVGAGGERGRLGSTLDNKAKGDLTA